MRSFVLDNLGKVFLADVTELIILSGVCLTL